MSGDVIAMTEIFASGVDDIAPRTTKASPKEGHRRTFFDMSLDDSLRRLSARVDVGR
jgi:hypothetical protein